jgi:hypothetical protein
MDNIFQIVKRAEKNLIHGKPLKLGKYAEHDHVEKISTIQAYINSQHISGKYDSTGREKPFNNIVLMAVYAWYKLTDIDRKHIRFKPRNAKQRLKSLIATIKLRLWMDRKQFGQWLNLWGWTLSAYGSCVTKFVEKGGKLIPTVVDWDKLICDPVDFYSGVRVEKLYFTPSELKKQGYDEESVELALNYFKESRETLEGDDIDIKNEYVGVYEVHGELPMYHLTGKEEDTDLRQQMHVIFMMQSVKDKKNVNISLYSGKEAKDPYYISHLIKQDDRTLSIGAVESLFDAQWMVNHSAKLIKDQFDLASKLITQTSDDQFLGRNLLTDVDTGSVLIHRENQPLTQVNNQSHDIPNMMGFMDSWKQAGRDISGAHESVTGEQQPSGTPYRLGAMLNAEARGLYNIMRQSKGLHLEEMLRLFILPYFKKTLKNTDEIVATLEGEELENLDNLMLPAKLEAALLPLISQGLIPTPEQLQGLVDETGKDLGNTRFITPSKHKDKTWADYFKDLDWEAIEIEITGENRDKQSILITLDTLLQRIMANPQALADPNVRKIMNRIIDEVDGLSPLQLTEPEAPPMEGTTGGTPQGPSEMLGAIGGAGEVGAPIMT